MPIMGNMDNARLPEGLLPTAPYALPLNAPLRPLVFLRHLPVSASSTLFAAAGVRRSKCRAHGEFPSPRTRSPARRLPRKRPLLGAIANSVCCGPACW